MSLALDSPEHDHTFCQADGGKLPVTDQFYEAITKTGHGICHVFKEKSWKNAINKADYYEHDFTPEIPEDLAGGICCHGLMPLQSKKKKWVEIQRHINGWLIFMQLFGALVM